MPGKSSKKKSSVTKAEQKLAAQVKVLRSHVRKLESEVESWRRRAGKQKDRVQELRAKIEKAVADATSMATGRATGSTKKAPAKAAAKKAPAKAAARKAPAKAAARKAPAKAAATKAAPTAVAKKAAARPAAKKAASRTTAQTTAPSKPMIRASKTTPSAASQTPPTRASAAGLLSSRAE